MLIHGLFSTKTNVVNRANKVNSFSTSGEARESTKVYAETLE